MDQATQQAAVNGNGAKTYADGQPQDVVQFFDAKLILKPDFFGTVRGFKMFSDLVAEAVSRVKKVSYQEVDLKKQRPRLREVMFVDTADFRLYNNSFILRRRTEYQDGFPIGDPEVVFKFRNPDRDKVAETDVRPKIAGPYRIKLKAEALPLKDEVGGYRVLYSHNSIFPMSSVHRGDRTNLKTIAQVFSPLAGLIGASEEHVSLVNSTLVEEVLMDLGMITLGKGLVAKANISLWRSLGDHTSCAASSLFRPIRPSVGRRPRISQPRRRTLHQAATGRRRLAILGTTKTGLVYRLKGNPPQAHE